VNATPKNFPVMPVTLQVVTDLPGFESIQSLKLYMDHRQYDPMAVTYFAILIAGIDMWDSSLSKIKSWIFSCKAFHM
jgi:hypothetical protein